MATSLATTLQVALSAIQTNPLDLSVPRDQLSYGLSDSLAQGTAPDLADLIWHDRRTVTGAAESLDLAAVLLSAWGAALSFVKVKAILIKNRSVTPGEILLVGGAAANAFINWVADATDIVQIGPDGLLLLWNPKDGYAVTAGTGDLLKIDPGANTIEYDIVIIGTSA